MNLGRHIFVAGKMHTASTKANASNDGGVILCFSFRSFVARVLSCKLDYIQHLPGRQILLALHVLINRYFSLSLPSTYRDSKSRYALLVFFL